jgi:predicted metal-dependent HD superfamily phosphohydrolase
MANLTELKTAWMELAGKFSDKETLNDRFFAEFQKQYTHPNRYYHNLTHVGKMLQAVERYAGQLEDADAVRFAVWFHDVVYQPIRSDNEAKSAELAENALLQLSFPAQRIEKVKEMIARTHNHTEQLPAEDVDTRFFLDFDLLILGSEWSEYQVYTSQIRREYAMFPDFMYNPGRLKVLRKFVDMPFIYRTSVFRAALEKQARENLQAEINQLK